MNVLYLSQLFETGSDPGSDRNLFFCKQLHAQGHKVTVITSNVDYKKAQPKFPGDSWKVSRNVEGIEVIYVYSYANFRGSFVKRFWYYMTYMLPTLIAGLQLPKPDVVYAVSTPLNVGLLGYLISKWHGVRFVFEVTDIWPDAAIATKVVKSPILIGLAKWLEKFCYAVAAHIVVLGEGGKSNIIHKGISPQKITVITNGVDLSLFPNPDTLDNEREATRRKQGFGNKFVCMYLGAHGAYNALWTIIDAAKTLKEDSRFLFVFVGDGDEKKHLQDEIEKCSLSNILFLPPAPRSESCKILNAADIFLLPNRKGTFFTGNLPNKLFDYLACGRPIVVAGKGESADLILRAQAGKVVDAEDGQAMAKAIDEMANADPVSLKYTGTSARNYVLANYSRELLGSKFILTLKNALDRKK